MLWLTNTKRIEQGLNSGIGGTHMKLACNLSFVLSMIYIYNYIYIQFGFTPNGLSQFRCQGIKRFQDPSTELDHLKRLKKI